MIIKKQKQRYSLNIRFCGENVSLLKGIKRRLENEGYNLSIHKNHSKGDFSYHRGVRIQYNEDYYVLEISRKQQVLDLLRKIPIRHPEKMAKIDLIFDVERRKLVYWQDIEYKVKSLKSKIKESVQQKKCLVLE